MSLDVKWVSGITETTGIKLFNRRRTQTDTDFFARATLPEQRKLSLRDKGIVRFGRQPVVPICRLRTCRLLDALRMSAVNLKIAIAAELVH